MMILLTSVKMSCYNYVVLIQSTFLQSLLKELPPVEGNIVVNGSVAYASQEPWVFSGSFQENVLFGASYNVDWYQQVIQACALDTVRQYLITLEPLLMDIPYEGSIVHIRTVLMIPMKEFISLQYILNL